MAFTVAEVEAVLKLRDELSAELRKVTSTIETSATGWSKSFSNVGKLMAGAFTVGAIVSAAKAVVGFAGDLEDMSARTGIGTTALQELKFAGEQVGVSLDSVAGAVGQLQNRLVSGDKGAVAAIAQLGLNLNTLRQMRPEDQFTAVAKAISGIEDPAARTKLAMDVMGRGALAVMPLIVSNLDEMRMKAESLGIVMDESTVKSLDDLGDAMDAAKMQGMAIIGNVLAPFIPALTAAANGVITLSSAIKDGLMFAFNALASGAQRALALVADGLAEMFAFAGKFSDKAKGIAVDLKAFAETAHRAADESAAMALGLGSTASAAGDVSKKFSVMAVETDDARAATAKLQKELDKQATALRAIGNELAESEIEQIGKWAVMDAEGIKMLNRELALQEEELRAIKMQQKDAAALMFLNQELDLYQTQTRAVEDLGRALREMENERGLKLMAQDARELKGVFGNLFDGVKEGWKGLKEGLTGGEGVGGFMKNLGSGVMDGFGSIVSGGMTSLMNMAVGLAMKGLAKLGSWVKGLFGPSGEEKDARKVMDSWVDGLELTASQMEEVQLQVSNGWQEHLAKAAIAIRDAYLSTGRSAEEAERVTKRLFDSTQQSGAAVAAVLKEIEPVMRESFEKAALEATNVATDGFDRTSGAVHDTMMVLKDLTGPEYEALKARSTEILTLIHGLWTEVHNATLAARNAVFAYVDALGPLHGALAAVHDAAVAAANAIASIPTSMAFNVDGGRTGTGGGGGDSDREAAFQAWLPGFLADNPGDEGRARDAFGFASGGIVTSPMLGLVGEAGPEAIVPLDEYRRDVMGGSEHDEAFNHTLATLLRIEDALTDQPRRLRIAFQEALVFGSRR